MAIAPLGDWEKGDKRRAFDFFVVGNFVGNVHIKRRLFIHFGLN